MTLKPENKIRKTDVFIIFGLQNYFIYFSKWLINFSSFLNKIFQECSNAKYFFQISVRFFLSRGFQNSECGAQGHSVSYSINQVRWFKGAELLGVNRANHKCLGLCRGNSTLMGVYVMQGSDGLCIISDFWAIPSTPRFYCKVTFTCTHIPTRL